VQGSIDSFIYTLGSWVCTSINGVGSWENISGFSYLNPVFEHA
jgi:hypothetical protein